MKQLTLVVRSKQQGRKMDKTSLHKMICVLLILTCVTVIKCTSNMSEITSSALNSVNYHQLHQLIIIPGFNKKLSLLQVCLHFSCY